MRIWKVKQKELAFPEEIFEEEFPEKELTPFVKSNPSKKIYKVFISQ